MPKIINRAEDKDAKKASAKQEYILLRGKHFGFDDKGNELQYEPGESVLLTDAQYESFRDKFATPDEYHNRRTDRDRRSTPAPAPEPTSAPAPAKQ